MVDEQVEIETQPQQYFLGVGHVRNPGIAERPEVDRVEVVAQVLERPIGQGNACFEVGIGAVIEPLELDRYAMGGAGGFRGLHGGLGYLEADSISRDHRDACQ